MTIVLLAPHFRFVSDHVIYVVYSILVILSIDIDWLKHLPVFIVLSFSSSNVLCSLTPCKQSLAAVTLALDFVFGE